MWKSISFGRFGKSDRNYYFISFCNIQPQNTYIGQAFLKKHYNYYRIAAYEFERAKNHDIINPILIIIFKLIYYVKYIKQKQFRRRNRDDTIS